MAESERSLVIIGGGLAGARAAEGAREAGYGGPLVLVGAESVPPYIRPPLSKEFLAGAGEREAVDVHPRAWYDEHGVQLRLGRRAQRLDTAAHVIALDDGTELQYERALLATGLGPKDVAQRLIVKTGRPRRELYQLALALAREAPR